jgi:aspartyl/asparaginyl beta-hydroxylase (cupin superfamily)
MTVTKQDLTDLFLWAKNADLPIRKGPTAEGYTNNPINYCWLKGVGNGITIRKKLMPENIIKIFENSDILFSMKVIFAEGTELSPHKDPNIYREPYKRIQIPLVIPDKEKCYMIWKGEKIHWSEGEPQVFEVMDIIHEGYNYSDSSMIFLFVDVKKSVEVEI